MADARIHPHFLIDGLPRWRARALDHLSKAPEPRPFILTTDVVRSSIESDFVESQWSSHRLAEFLQNDPVDADDEQWALPVHRFHRYHPARLIESLAMPGVHPRELSGFLNLFEAVGAYFTLSPGDRVRIACAGDRHALLEADKRAAWDPHERLFLQGKLARAYANGLRDFLKTVPLSRFDWLAHAFPELHRATRRLARRKWSPHVWRGARQARRDLERHPSLVDVQGSVALIYWRTGMRWHLFSEEKEAPLSIDDLMEAFVIAGPKRSNASLLVVIAPEGEDRCNPLDNPIVSRRQLERAEAAGVTGVILDRRFGLYYDDLAGIRDVAVMPPGLPIYLA